MYTIDDSGQLVPSKRGMQKFLNFLWNPDGSAKGFVSYPPDPTDQPGSSRKAKIRDLKRQKRLGNA